MLGPGKALQRSNESGHSAGRQVLLWAQLEPWNQWVLQSYTYNFNSKDHNSHLTALSAEISGLTYFLQPKNCIYLKTGTGNA